MFERRTPHAEWSNEAVLDTGARSSAPWCDPFFVNQSIDSQKWAELSSALNACLSRFGFYPPRCSEAPPPTPFCNAGTCDGRQV